MIDPPGAPTLKRSLAPALDAFLSRELYIRVNVTRGIWLIPILLPLKKNHKQIANIMQRRPDWLGRLLVPLLVINIAGVCKRTLASRCLVLINSSYALLGSSVAVHGEHPAWIAVGVCTPGLPLVSVDSKQHISLLFPIGSAPLLHECWCFPHDWGGRKWLYFIHTVFCTQP